MKTPGKLTLRGQLDLHLMLRSAVQPGAKLDFEYPVETVTLTFKSSGNLQFAGARGARIAQLSGTEAQLTTESRKDGWLPLQLELATGADWKGLEVSWHTAEDSRARALPLRRVLLPWAEPKSAVTTAPTARVIPEIAGGDWERGRQVFAGAGACLSCHQVNGDGGVIGPDLSNLVHRDYASVLKDIVDPSAAINPDRIAYHLELKDGTSLLGMILEDTRESVVVAEVAGSKRTIAKSGIKAMKASAVSLMPPGLWSALAPQQQKDLMTFLLLEKPAKK